METFFTLETIGIFSIANFLMTAGIGAYLWMKDPIISSNMDDNIDDESDSEMEDFDDDGSDDETDQDDQDDQETDYDESENEEDENGTEDDEDQEKENEISDLELISMVRNANTVNKEKNVESLDDMTESLISMTENIVGNISDATIPNSDDKKKRLSVLLTRLSDVISDITKMDGKELGTILNRNSPPPKIQPLRSPSTPVMTDEKLSEREILVSTLDSLRK